MGRYQDILDIFRFRGRKLSAHKKPPISIPGGIDRGTIVTERNATHPVLTLIFVAPFTDFSKLWDIVAGLLFFSCGRAPKLGRGRNQENAAVSDRDEARRGKEYLRNGNDDNGFITVSRSDLPI